MDHTPKDKSSNAWSSRQIKRQSCPLDDLFQQSEGDDSLILKFMTASDHTAEHQRRRGMQWRELQRSAEGPPQVYS